jgi:hypothetical protein
LDFDYNLMNSRIHQQIRSAEYDPERFKNKLKVGEGAYGIVVKAYD